jgi:alanyl-tRNA synthetase
MNSIDIKRKFLRFFREKKHEIVPSSSLIPADSSVLFTTAGMQQFVDYLSGKKDVLAEFNNRHLASCQKCFRTLDIDEVGDDTHHTFFEMLGNWSIGQDEEGKYFKEGAIELALDFFVNQLSIEKEKIWVTVFKGEAGVPKDQEARKIWSSFSIPQERITEFGLEDNFWGPTSQTGPCGPCSEIYYDRGEEKGCGRPDCGPNCPYCQRFVELWNLVFMEYNKDEAGNYTKLSQKNVDTGIGFERLTAVLQNKESAYETDIFIPIIEEIEKLAGQKYEGQKSFRIIADHIRGSVFLASEGVLPSNTEHGYILRRLIRRIVRFSRTINLREDYLSRLAKKVIESYDQFYPELSLKQTEIALVLEREKEKFEKTLESGLKRFEKIIEKGNVSGENAFHLLDTYGFPLELTEELANERKLKVDKQGFQKAFEKHREISRAGAEKKFGGVGKEAGFISIKLHTATHLLHTALRMVLGEHVQQMGSDITEKRLRFDFSHPQKMEKEEIVEVERIINQKIKEGLQVEKKEMSYEQALNSGALAFFKEKYPEKVNVYTIKEKSGDKEFFSKEICAGPHVENISELGKFKIIKEESSGSGVRRIKAILE